MKHDRINWLVRRIRKGKFRVGAELGVKSGFTTRHLLRRNHSLHMFAVDLWAPQDIPQERPDGRISVYSGQGWPHEDIYKKFIRKADKYLKEGRLTVIRGNTSDEKVLAKVADKSLDFVFIDADHSYEGARADIINWRPKLKPSGLLCGHDIDWPGVTAAVSELVPGFQTADDAIWYEV